MSATHDDIPPKNLHGTPRKKRSRFVHLVVCCTVLYFLKATLLGQTLNPYYVFQRVLIVNYGLTFVCLLLTNVLNVANVFPYLYL